MTRQLCLAIALLFAGLSWAAKPNIVIVLVDDMGYGDPGCNNPHSKIRTTNIDRLAKEGMRFTDAHAPGPLCHLSRYGLMTGRYPFRTQVNVWRKQPVIKKNEMTIASLLRSQEYRTAMVGKWHLGFEEKGYDKRLPGGPVDRGFDTFFGIRASTDIPPYFYIRGDKAVSPPTDKIEANYSPGWTRIQGAFWRAGGIAPGLQLKDVLPRFTDEAMAVIQNHAATNKKADTERPLLLYLAFPAPHTPWLPSKEFTGRSGAGMYGDFALMVDAMIGRVMKSLNEAGMAKNTVVVFTSDNGPVWYETDVKRFGHDSSGGLRGMKADAWECGHRMPFLVRWPGRVKAGTVSDEMICFTDLMATFAEITGCELPLNAGPDSFSFLPVLMGKSKRTPVRQHLVIRSGGGHFTIRDGNWKLIDRLGSGGFSAPRRITVSPTGPKGQLYDLARDPGETRNLYQEHPQVVRRLLAKLAEIRQAGRSRSSP